MRCSAPDPGPRKARDQDSRPPLTGNGRWRADGSGTRPTKIALVFRQAETHELVTRSLVVRHAEKEEPGARPGHAKKRPVSACLRARGCRVRWEIVAANGTKQCRVRGRASQRSALLGRGVRNAKVAHGGAKPRKNPTPRRPMVGGGVAEVFSVSCARKL